MPQLSESPLINRRVIEELTPPLLNVARRMLQRAEDAEDVVQEMWISALRSAHGFEGRSSLRTWLTGIQRTRINDRYRKEQRFDPLLFEVAAEAKLGPDQLDLRSARGLVNAALAGMRELDRAAVVACDIEDLDRDQAAARLGISRVHLRVLLFRARERLERQLQQAGLGAEILS
jgi:RNA polymerase sigma-70 factor (ECF subfamily)